MIVADSNLIAYLLIPGPFSRDARSVLEQDAIWAAPPLWRSEIRNILSTYVKSREMPLADALVLMREAETILYGNEYDPPSAEVLSLAKNSGCSAYDCEFVALAQSLGVTLVTHDKQVLRAFREIARTPRAFLVRHGE